MDIEILGAHNLESRDSRHVSLLIDGVLAIEAGALTSSLSFPAQQQLRAILLTHQHYDHTKDIPAIGMNFSLHEATIDIYATQSVHDALTANLLNDKLYPDFTAKPAGKPSIRFKAIEPGRNEQIGGYRVLAVPVNHSLPAVGYQVTSADGRTLFYTGDTGPGLADCWRQVSPELLIIEVTAPNRYEAFARRAGHLTPDLLRQEMESFREIKGYLPQIVLVHMNPLEEKEIESEIAVAAGVLNAPIQFGYEGMRIHL